MKKAFIYCLIFSFAWVGSFARVYIPTVTSGHIDSYTDAMADFGVFAGDSIGIPVTVTAYISIAELHGDSLHHITVFNVGGPVNIVGGQIFIKNFSWVDMNFVDSTKGWGIRDSACTYQPFNIEGSYSHCTFGGARFVDCGDYVFHTVHSRVWDGTADSANHHNIFYNISIKRCADGWWMGDPNTGGGYWNYNECFGFQVDSFQESTFWHCNKCNFWNVHDNFLTHLALSDSTDAGVMDIHGSLDFYNNFCNYYSGSIVRGHLLTLVTDKNGKMITCHIFNNTWRNATKYGGPQINSLAVDTQHSYTRPAGVIIAFNSASKCQDRSYKSCCPFQGGAAFFDWYWCWGDTAIVAYNAYDNMHFDNGQNIATSYLYHSGTGQPLPDTIGNIRVMNPVLTYVDTVHNIPFLVSELTNKAVGQMYALLAYNKVARIIGRPAFVGPYNFGVQQLYIYRKHN